jgi:hypothetical protein
MLQHARLAYGKCNGFGLVRYVDKRFPEVAATVTAEVLRANVPSNPAADHSPMPPSAAFPTISGGGFRQEPPSEADAQSKDALKEGMLERKLNLESVLRSL